MERTLAVLGALLLLCGRMAGGTPPETPQGARPPGDTVPGAADNAVPGWTKAGSPRVFARADLYGYIDGGAELFLEFGFEQLTLQRYRSGANELAVEIYRMTDAAAATGIYLMKCGTETPDPSFRERHTLNRHQLMFVRERYYVTVNNLGGTDKMGPEMVKFGARVGATLPADRLPVELKALPPQGLVAGSARLVRGPFGLQSLYTLGEGDILQLGGRIVGIAGQYRDATGASYTLVLVTYRDATAAKNAYAGLQQNLDKYLKPLTTTPSSLTFRDYENRFGVLSLNGTQIEIRLHLASAPR